MFYCQSAQYQAINNAKQEALYQNQQKQFQQSYGITNPTVTAEPANANTADQKYNETVLGMKYDDSGALQNPFESAPSATSAPQQQAITCFDGSLPDANGCCAGEVYTDMGNLGFNCCPQDEEGADCFPPIK